MEKMIIIIHKSNVNRSLFLLERQTNNNVTGKNIVLSIDMNEIYGDILQDIDFKKVMGDMM